MWNWRKGTEGLPVLFSASCESTVISKEKVKKKKKALPWRARLRVSMGVRGKQRRVILHHKPFPIVRYLSHMQVFFIFKSGVKAADKNNMKHWHRDQSGMAGAQCEVMAPLEVLARKGAEPARAMRQATVGRATFCMPGSPCDQRSWNAPLLPCAKSDCLLPLLQLRNGGQVSRRRGHVRQVCAQGPTCRLGHSGRPSWAQMGTESTPSPSPFDARGTYTPSPESQPQTSRDAVLPHQFYQINRDSCL